MDCLRLEKKTILSWTFLIKWTLLALIIGFFCSSFTHFFIISLFFVKNLLKEISIFSVFLPVLGAFVVGFIIYQIDKNSFHESIPTYIKSIHIYKGKMPFKETVFKLMAVFFTVATFGCGGIIGPLGRINAGFASALFSFLRAHFKMAISKEDIQSSAICGLAATIAVIFHSPIGGGVFAVEILQRSEMKYRDLFPAILTSSVAVLCSQFFCWEPLIKFSLQTGVIDFKILFYVLILAVIVGVFGELYTFIYTYLSHFFKRNQGDLKVKVVLGSIIAAVLIYALNPVLFYDDQNTIQSIISFDTSVLSGNIPGYVPLVLSLILMVLAKMIANCITVASGMSAGFIGPVAFSGMLLGASYALFLGYLPNDPYFFAFVVTGFSGLLASAVNIPIAASIISVEVFGLEFGLISAVAAIIGFQINRNDTIYDASLEESNFF